MMNENIENTKQLIDFVSKKFNLELPKHDLDENRIISENILVYGIVGPKDSGKSTLIDRLCNKKVSIDKLESISGTTKDYFAAIYIHKDVIRYVKDRYDKVSKKIFYVEHSEDIIKNSVFIDLPDYDSIYEEHKEFLDKIKTYVDKYIWMTTISKYYDNTFLINFKSIYSSPENFIIIFNKMDLALNSLKGDDNLNCINRDDENRVAAIKDEFFNVVKKEICSLANIEFSTLRQKVYFIELINCEYDFKLLKNTIYKNFDKEVIEKIKKQNLISITSKNRDYIKKKISYSENILKMEESLKVIDEYFNEQFSDSKVESCAENFIENNYYDISSLVIDYKIKKYWILNNFKFLLDYFFSGNKKRNSSSIDCEKHFSFNEIHGYLENKNIENVRTIERVSKLNKNSITYYDENYFNDEIDKLKSFTYDKFIDDYKDPSKTTIFFITIFPILWLFFIQPILKSTVDYKGVMSIASSMITVLGAQHLFMAFVVSIFYYSILIFVIAKKSINDIENYYKLVLIDIYKKNISSMNKQIKLKYEEFLDDNMRLKDFIENKKS